MTETEQVKQLVSLLNSGDLEAVAEMLRRWPDIVKLQGEFGFTAVVFAIDSLSGCPEALPLLAAAGADMNARMGEDGRTPLCMAADHGDNLQAVWLLLVHGADPNLPDNTGWTPVDYAVGYCEPSRSPACVEILDFLLQAGADPNPIGPDKKSPLDAAYFSGDGRAVRLLLDHGARLQRVVDTEEGSVALSLAAFCNDGGDPTVAVDVLLAAGISIDARDSYGRTALHAAALTGDAAMVAYLLA